VIFTVPLVAHSDNSI